MRDLIQGQDVIARIEAMHAGLERWAPFRGGIYEVSTMGNIRRATSGIATFVGRPIHPNHGPTGYAQIGLSTGNGRKQLKTYVHRVVAEVFLGRCPTGCVVNHKNGDRQDNRLSNLEYITHAGNMRHARDHLPRHVGPVKGRPPPKGLQVGDKHWSRRTPEKMARGEKQGASKLTESIVLEIRQRVADGPRGTQFAVAKEFGISVAQCSRIVRRTRWAHI